jgi:hypothetical protein
MIEMILQSFVYAMVENWAHRTRLRGALWHAGRKEAQSRFKDKS